MIFHWSPAAASLVTAGRSRRNRVHPNRPSQLQALKAPSRRVGLAKNANVQGDIHYLTLSIEEGAVIDGQIKRNSSGGKSDSEMKSSSGDSSSDANVASLKPSVIGGDGKSPAVSAASGMKSPSSKPLAG